MLLVDSSKSCIQPYMDRVFTDFILSANIDNKMECKWLRMSFFEGKGIYRGTHVSCRVHLGVQRTSMYPILVIHGCSLLVDFQVHAN